MVLVVQNVHEVAIEGMDVVEFREVLNDGLKFLMDVGSCEFHLAHVEFTNTSYLVARMDDCRGFSLSFREHNIDALGGCGNRLNILEVVSHGHSIKY